MKKKEKVQELVYSIHPVICKIVQLLKGGSSKIIRLESSKLEEFSVEVSFGADGIL